MEKKRIPVRPHHGMCLAYFIGKGYSEGFSAHMEKMLHILEQDVPIRLVVSLDDAEELKHEIKHRLEHEGIGHATLEFELCGEHCAKECPECR